MKNFSTRLVSTRLSNRNLNKKETAMSVLKYLAATMVVVLISTTAFAQQPPAVPPASASATPVAPATPAVGAPAPASSPFFCSSNLECLALKDLLVNMGVEFGKDWAKGVREALDVLVTDKDTRKDLDNLPKGAVEQMAYLGKDPMNRASFDKRLAEAQCSVTGKDADRKESDGCKTLADKIAPLVKKAIDSTKAEPAVKTNAQYLYAKATGGLMGDQKIAMLQLAGLMLPFGEWASAFGVTDATNLLIGKNGCFLRDGQEAKCGPITAADATGVTIGGEKVGWDKLQGGGDTVLAIGDTKLMKENWGKGGGSGDYASQHPVALEARFVLRRGWASQYDSAGMTGGLVAACLNVHDNLCLLGGVGVLSLSGQPTLGTEENDGTTLFAAMLGAHALLGSRAWPVAPMLEANVTLQGERPGVEGVLGIQSAEGLRKVFPVDLRLGASLGYYPTGVKPYTHPFKEVNDFNLFGVGFMAAAGYTF